MKKICTALIVLMLAGCASGGNGLKKSPCACFEKPAAIRGIS